jgi:hypothetical protein
VVERGNFRGAADVCQHVALILPRRTEAGVGPDDKELRLRAIDDAARLEVFYECRSACRSVGVVVGCAGTGGVGTGVVVVVGRALGAIRIVARQTDDAAHLVVGTCAGLSNVSCDVRLVACLQRRWSKTREF